MFKSLQLKMVLALVLLAVSVMSVAGAVLVNGVSTFYINAFVDEISSALTGDFFASLEGSKGSVQSMKSLVDAYSSTLGIDTHRDYFILSSDGEFLDGSNTELGKALEVTPNLMAAMNGRIGDRNAAFEDYMDYALPFQSDGKGFILYFKDTKDEMRDVIWMLVFIILQALLIAMALAVALSVVLSKAITGPIKSLTDGAKKISSGVFSYKLKVHSNDEIGTLTQTFDYMARQLRKTLDEVNRERNKLETIFSYLTDGVIAFGSDKSLLHINNAAQNMLKLSGEHSDFDSIFAPLGLSVDFNELLSLDSYIKHNVSLDERHMEVYFASFKQNESDIAEAGGVIAVIHDITEQQKLELSRREFVANVSHELRTPLTSIKGATETVLDNPDIPPEMTRKFLQVVIGEADRMTRIVKDLLVLSRLDSNKLEWHFACFSVAELLKRVCEAMKIEASRHGHELTLNLAENLPEMTGDAERLEQVVVNIVSNAIKYTPSNGKIEISAAFDGERVNIKVKDNGIGIPEKDLPRLFERFYRVDKARSREAGGTGLGLAIAMEIVHAHGGDIKIQSAVGKGTEVTVILPAAVQCVLDARQ